MGGRGLGYSSLLYAIITVFQLFCIPINSVLRTLGHKFQVILKAKKPTLRSKASFSASLTLMLPPTIEALYK